MSTAKFNISEMGEGNDTHSNFLISKGYGNLLNRPGRQEITIDTASMYKKAADQGAILGAGVGGIAGGIGGSEIADALGGSATAKLMGALVGAGVGGVGGYYAGKSLDKVDSDTGTSAVDRNRHLIYSGAGSALGALTGYGVSKYLMGSKNKTHHVISALLGAGAGAGAGYLVAGDKEYNANVDEARATGRKLGISPDKLDEFAHLVANHKDRIRKSTGITGIYDRLKWKTTDTWYDTLFRQDERDAYEAALKELNGTENPKEISPIKLTAEGLLAAKLSGAAYRTVTRGKINKVTGVATKPLGVALQKMVANDGTFMDYVLNNANIKSLTPKMQRQLWADMQAAMKADPNWINTLSPQALENLKLFDKKYFKKGLFAMLKRTGRGLVRAIF